MQASPTGRRKPKSWRDVQLIVSSISIAGTLGLWSLWASREKPQPVDAASTVTPTAELTATATQLLMLPGQVVYLGTAVPPPTAAAQSQYQPNHRKGGGGGSGGGGGGGGGGASTGSS